MQPQQNPKFSILVLYAPSQTFTSTVYDHVSSFAKYSENAVYYLDFEDLRSGQVDLTLFDVVIVHYSVRLPFGNICDVGIKKLRSFKGLKILFIQDEYDHTNRAKEVIRQAAFQIVFTVVPPNSIALIYPPVEFPGVTFVNNLTGYVPDLPISLLNEYIPPSKRRCVIVYRGRHLPIRYGHLGQEKVQIGIETKSYCEANQIEHDISWTEETRIYGDTWYQFISSSKAMLGSESGSNVFNWDGRLQERIDNHKKLNKGVSDTEIYNAVVAPLELTGVMNQISPRVFEMVAMRTVMVLFEGSYSGLLIPNRHYIPLKKDFSNLDEVFSILDDDEKIDAMVSDTFEDIIRSEKYSYRTFVNFVDQHIASAFDEGTYMTATSDLDKYRPRLKFIEDSVSQITPPALTPVVYSSALVNYLVQLQVVNFLWRFIPFALKAQIRKSFGRV